MGRGAEVGQGFEAFFGEHYREVERAVAVAIGDDARAEEMAQEAFARAFRHWRRVERMDRPVAWIYVVALNAERKRWRRERNAPVLNQPTGGTDHASAVVTAVDLRAAIVRLPPRQRAAIVLRYLADLSVADVAAVMGIAEGTVKATVNQALQNLRVDVGEEDE
jgi:RNA polymerase sigma-70 factor (ECF subfamily)